MLNCAQEAVILFCLGTGQRCGCGTTWCYVLDPWRRLV